MFKYIFYFLLGNALIASITIIAERNSPRVAGILMTLPTITFLSLLLIAIEQGVEFASSAAMWNPIGLVADVIFLGIFALGTRISRSLVISLFLAFTSYFTSILLLRSLPIANGFQALALLWLSCAAAYISFRKLNARKFQQLRASWKQILFRGSFGGIVITSIILLSDIASAKWSGIFSAFPGTITPVLIVLYLSYGREMTDSVIRDSPLGLIGTGLYAFTIWLLYPRENLPLPSSTFIAFLILIAYLLVISLLRYYFEQQPFNHGHSKL
ncbi:MAG: hypothetical protein QXQ02_00425 [Halobacteria archaeon]